MTVYGHILPGAESIARHAALVEGLSAHEKQRIVLVNKASGLKWGKEKAIRVEARYGDVLLQLCLAFEGIGVVSSLHQDIATFWRAHILLRDYTSDSMSLCRTVKLFEGATLEEKFPDDTD